MLDTKTNWKVAFLIHKSLFLGNYLERHWPFTTGFFFSKSLCQKSNSFNRFYLSTIFKAIQCQSTFTIVLAVFISPIWLLDFSSYWIEQIISRSLMLGTIRLATNLHVVLSDDPNKKLLQILIPHQFSIYLESTLGFYCQSNHILN